MRKYILPTLSLIIVTLFVTAYAQSRGTPSTLRVKIDANGALVTAAAAQVSPITTVTFNNARLAVDASGNLLTVVSGGSGVGTVTSVATSSPITGGTITSTGTIACATCGVTGSPLSQFASTTSTQLANTISNETGFDGVNGVAVFSQAPTFGGSIFSPVVYGGAAVASTLTLVSTNAIGTTDKILLKVGNNGGTQSMAIYDNANIFIGTESTSGNYGTQPNGLIHAVGVSSTVYCDHISADAVPCAIIGRKARGTVNTPTQVSANDNLVQIIGQGWETTTPGWSSAANGVVGIQATEGFTSTAQGTKLIVNLTPTGSVTAARFLTGSASGMIFSQVSGTAMAVANVGANSCGTTTATIAGNQTVGEVTVGATSGTQCRVTVPQATTTRFNGSCNNQTTAALCRLVAVSTTTFDLVGAFTAGDVVAYFVASR